MAFDIFPQFHFDQYTMRPLKIDDALAYYEYMTHDAVSQFINRSNRVHSINKAEEEINYWRKLFYNRQGIYWGIALNDTLIGTAGYNMLLLQDRKGEISYDLKYEYWGRGIMSNALKLIMAHSCSVFNLVRIQATTITTNTRSIKLLEKLGFIREGTLKNFETVDGINMLASYMYAKIYS